MNEILNDLLKGRKNPLRLMSTRDQGNMCKGSIVVMKGQLYRIAGFDPSRRYPWLIINTKGGTLHGQAKNSRLSGRYIQPLPVANRLASITHSTLGVQFVGRKVLIWANGLSPMSKWDYEGVITDFDTFASPRHHWQCRIDEGTKWHTQADNPMESYYIVLEEDWNRMFTPEDVGAAGMLSRAFLGE